MADNKNRELKEQAECKAKKMSDDIVRPNDISSWINYGKKRGFIDFIMKKKEKEHNDYCDQLVLQHNSVMERMEKEHKKEIKEFYLIDYKGKFTIICDELDELDHPVGKISREDAIKYSADRVSCAGYFGVPAYIGKDKELNKIYVRKDYRWEASYLPAGEDSKRYLFKTKEEAEKWLDKKFFDCPIHTGRKGKERCPSCDAEWGIYPYED